MPYRFVWRKKGEMRFEVGTFFDLPENAIAACERAIANGEDAGYFWEPYEEA